MRPHASVVTLPAGQDGEHVVRLSLLGPVEATAGSERVDLGGPKPRLVLALLALDAGRIVSVDRLVSALWDGDVPADPRAALQVNISNLRRALSGTPEVDAPRPRIEHDGGGYVLRIERSNVDVHRFEALVTEGSHLVSIEPRRGATVLRDALNLWRGRPFGDLADEPALTTDVRRLEELRLRAVERRIAAELELGDHERLVEELRALVDAHPLREPFWGQLALARYRSGRQAEALRTFEQLRARLAEELGVDPSPPLRDLHARMLRQDPSLDAPRRPGEVRTAVQDRLGRTPADVPVRNPYKGLRAFREDDHEDFFGRTELTTSLAEQVAAHPLLALVGPSGSGKSSVVRAGLIPALHDTSPPDADRWIVATMTPGEWPMAELERTLGSVAPEEADGLGRVLSDRTHGFVDAAGRVLSDGERLVLVVDQFEEIFALARDADRDAFLEHLATAAATADGRVHVVLTLRADFYDRLLLDPGLGPAVAERTVPVTPLGGVQVENAVRGPAERVGLTVEPELVAAIVADIVDAPGSLPMLQYALTELCDQRDGPTLRLEDYQRIGGLRGALAGRADELYEEFDEEARQVARQILLRLVAVTEDVVETRRRVLRPQLRALGPEGTVARVLETFGAHRLLTFDRDPFTGVPTVEVAHEALTRAWGRLRGWIDAAREDLVMHRRLLAAANEWRVGSRDPSYLLRGVRLEQTLEWAEASSIRLADEERSYLEASVRARDERLEAERRRERREEELERRSLRRLRALVAVLVVGLVSAAGLSLLALQQRDRARDQQAVAQEQRAAAERQERIATARELAAAAIAQLDTDPERSVLLAIEAVETTRQVDGTVLPEAESALHRALRSSRVQAVHPSGGGVAAAPDGSLALVGMDGTLEVRDPDGQVRWQIDGRPTSPLLTAPDGPVPLTFLVRTPDVDIDASAQRLATTDRDLTVEVRDLADGQVLASLDGPAIRPRFSPDGGTIAAVLVDAENQTPWGAARTVALFDAQTGELIRRLGAADTSVLDHTFSPDGSRLATVAPMAGSLRIWDTATGEELAALGRRGAKAVAFSPDGTRLAVGTAEGLVDVRDADTLEQQAVFRDHDGDIFAVAFSPDGSRVVVAGSGAELFDPSTGAGILRLAGHPGVIADVAFLADGHQVVTSAEDGTTRVWDVADAGGRELVNLPGPPPPARGVVAFSTAGDLLAAAAPDGIRIYETGMWDVVRTLPARPPAVSEVVFSPDGSHVAAGLFTPPPAGATGVLALWELDTGEEVMRVPGHGGMIFDLAFDVDGRRIATGTDDEGLARVFEVGDVDPVSTYRLRAGTITSVEFVPEGLFVGGQSSAYVVDPATGEQLLAFDEVDQTIVDDVLSEDGMLVTGDLGGRVRVWDPATGDLVRTLRRAPGGGVGAVAVQGDLVASAGPGGVVVHEFHTGATRLELETGHDGPAADLGISPDGRYLATTSADGTVRLFVLPTDDLLELARSRVTRELTEDECRRFLHRDACP